MLKTENFAFKIYPEKVVSIKETKAWGLLPKTPVTDNPGNCYEWSKLRLSMSHHENIRQIPSITILNMLLLYLLYVQKTHLYHSLLFPAPLLHDSCCRFTKSSAGWIIQYSSTYPYLQIYTETFQYQQSENSFLWDFISYMNAKVDRSWFHMVFVCTCK